MAIFKEYRKAVQNEHGWEAKLTCPDCGHTGLPRYEGWNPNRAINFGNNPTIFARVACESCGRNLRAVAGEKLRAMFSEITVPKANKRLIVWFVIAVILGTTLPMVAQSVFWPDVYVAWLGIILVGPLIFVFNYQMASMRKRCPWGTPKYIFMGLLGRSCCYRCSSCGNLLRLRD